MLRNRGFLIGLIVAALLTASGYYYYTQIYAPPEQAVADTVQSTLVRRGNLVISASGSGELIAAEDVSLGYTSGGVLAEVPVSVGDHVAVGDLLARLDDLQARQTLISAELQVAQAQEALDSAMDTEAAQRDVDLAQAKLDQAQLALDELLNWTPDEQAVQQAQANLEAAQASYDASKNKSVSDQMTSARISLEQAQEALQNAQATYDNAWDPARDWELYTKGSRLESERDAATANLEKAQQNLEVAQANYNLTRAGIDGTGQLNAWSQVLSAQAALDAAQQGPDQSEILAARIQVLQAQTDLAQVLASQTSDPKLAQLTLEQAQLNLESAQRTVDQLELVAPISGVVTAVDAEAGQSVGSSPFITLSNLDQPMVEIYLDETDLDLIAVGNEVDVVFDALPDTTFTGRVLRIEPNLVTVEGVPTVVAVAALDGDGLKDLPAGLNASADVISGRAENALLVSVEALRELSPGEYAVFVVKDDGSLEMRPVEVGLMDYANAEILSGLQQGERVSTGIVEKN